VKYYQHAGHKLLKNEGTKDTPRRRITVMSSFKEISMDQLVVKGDDIFWVSVFFTNPPPPPKPQQMCLAPIWHLFTLNLHCIPSAGLPINMIVEVSWEPKRRLHGMAS
jgi:hypothetical protein